MKNLKLKREQILEMEAVEIYKLVLSGALCRFPKGFWQQPEAVNNSISCIKFLIEELLELSEEDILNSISRHFFFEHKLSGMLECCFSNSPYLAINSAYPGRFKEWQFKNTPRNFWNINTGAEATKWLIEEKLKISDDELKRSLSVSLFTDNGLSGMIFNCFEGSPFMAINSAYPNKFKEWEFCYTPSNYWTIETGIQATKWLIEEKLCLSDEELKEKLSQKLFIENDLWSMLSICFNGSPFGAINATYPDKFKIWEFSKTPSNYWTIETGIQATKWLIEEKLCLSDEELKAELSIKLFIENNLFGMLLICFNGSPFGAINATYPDKFKIWEFSRTSNNYWTIETGIQATKWLIEEKLKISDDELKRSLSVSLFNDNGLSGMLSNCFDNSPFKAINATYPDKFKIWEFSRTPNNYWTIETGIQATRWLIEDKLKLSDTEILEKLSIESFRDNNLGGMIQVCFSNNVSKAISASYPEKSLINNSKPRV